MRIRLKCVYELPSPADGRRLLVDRYWPRGLTKARVSVDEWLPELAPSRQLLNWLRSHLSQWNEFERRYVAELSCQSAVVDRVRRLAAQQTLTLVYASKERANCPARVLAQHLVTPDEALQDPEVQVAYLRQIRRQSRYAQYAFGQLEDIHADEQRVKQAMAGTTELEGPAARYHPQELADRVDEFVHMNIQNFLVAAANVSKMLNGGSGIAPNRPTVMSRLLGSISGSRFLKDRTLRKFFEHFDERLDSWAANAMTRDIDVDDYRVELSPHRELWFPTVKVVSSMATFDLARLAMCMLGVEMAVNEKLRELIPSEDWAAYGIEIA